MILTYEKHSPFCMYKLKVSRQFAKVSHQFAKVSSNYTKMSSKGFRIERIFSSYIVFIFVIKIFDTKIATRDQCAKLHVLNKFLEINKRPSVTRASELYTDLSE